VIPGPYRNLALIGFMFDGAVSNVFATGAVSGSNPLGGIVSALFNGSFSHSYWDVSTTGRSTTVAPESSAW